MQKLINFLKNNFPNGIQMFNTRNIPSDFTVTIYDENGITVNYCPYWEYIEVFGLSDEEFTKIEAEINGIE